MGDMLEQNGEEYVHQAYTELSPLTGMLYNRAFLKRADQFLSEIKWDEYVLVAVDIVHFKLFNKVYGREEGDKILIKVARALERIEKECEGIAGYIGADNFCVIMKNSQYNITRLENEVRQCLEEYNNAVCFYPVLGIYEIVDATIPAVVMYDKATMASSKAKDVMFSGVCRYDADVEEEAEKELKLLVEIQEGLDREEFTFFAQPQCDIATGKIVGAESLVRWKHRTKGLIPPGVFIPVLEKNGLIADLDKYVWKRVCKWLRDWMDRGYRPIPISINVSRVDIFSMDVPTYLSELIKYYNIPPKYLKVEITEGAYVEDGGDINKTVKEFRDIGFTVMMDDFGSGYSSLNMLKDVVVDVLKLDMRFLDIDDNNKDKGIGIVESVINMAKIMGLPIIVEGVENERQEKFLLEMGCRYTQGYYYYRPLTIEQLEELLADERKLDYDGVKCRQYEEMKVREFLDGNTFSDAMVNNVLGATAFYDVYKNKIQITRANKQYYELTGMDTDNMTDKEAHLGAHARDDDKQKVLYLFEKAYANPEDGATANIHYIRVDGRVLNVYMRVFFMGEKEGHKLYYGSLIDLTEQDKKLESRMTEDEDAFDEEGLARVEKYYGNMPYEFAIGKIILNEENDPIDFKIVYVNHEMEDLAMGSTEKLKSQFVGLFGSKEKLLTNVYRAAYMGEVVEHVVYSPYTDRYIQMNFYQYEFGYTGCIVRDVTDSHIYEETMKNIMSSYREVYHINLQDNYYRMIYPDESNVIERGDFEESVNRHFGMGKIVDKHGENIRKYLSLENIKSELRNKDKIKLSYRRMAPDGNTEWCNTTISIGVREEGVPKTAILRIRSVEEQRREAELKRRQNMAGTLAGMSEGFFIYKADGEQELVYANSRVLEIYGCKSQKEFKEFVGNSFKGMVYGQDLARIQWEINDQIKRTEGQMDYIRYRIKRKDGAIRWIDDCGHLVEGKNQDEGRLFYVFISDITEEMSQKQQEKLINQNKYY